MRKPLVAFLLVVAVGVVAFIGVAVTRKTSLAFTLGVPDNGVAVVLKPNDTACQSPIEVPAGGAFDRVRLSLGTYFKAGPQVLVSVREGSSVVAHATLPGGYPDIGKAPSHVIDFGSTLRGPRYAVCLTNQGTRKVAVYGNGDAADRTSSSTLDGKPTGNDMGLIFERNSRSVGSELGRIGNRAVLFRSPRVSGTVYLLLLAALLVGAGVLLAAAVRKSVD